MTAPPDDRTPSTALASARPDSVDGELVRSRLMATLFGRASPPPRFGRFELRERIGQGGMGVVYRAWDPQLERAVAIKLIDTAGFAASLRERALREARSLARLAHPHVITVFEAGLSGERVWIAMEYVPGSTMREWLTRTPRPDVAAILRHWIGVGRGLSAVHAAGLIHRDVKPSNVLIGDDGRARLIDFGLVRAPEADAETSASDAGRTGESTDPATARSVGFVGTRAYAAPEQLQGAEVDAAADQFAFCVSVWESLDERRPPPLTRDGTLPATPRIPAPIHHVLARGLAKDPRARFASLAELLDELDAVVEGPARRMGLLLAAATVGAVVAGIAVGQLRGPAVATEPCSISASALAGTWDDARREGLRARFAASGLEFAATTGATFERGLDAWSATWLDARRASCAATRIEGVQSEAALDLRNACLERQRRAVEVTLDTVLSQSAGDDRSLVAQAPALLAGLPDLAVCADPQRLAEIEPLPGPGRGRDAVLRGYDVLSEARALAAAGALDGATAQVTAFAAEFPESASYAPLQLELAALPAQLELLRERVGVGVPPLVKVARDAAARRLDELAASLLVEAAEAAAGHWSEPELERWLFDEAHAALRRVDRPRDPRTISLRAAEAALLAESGRLDDALARYEEASALARELGDEARAAAQHLNVAATLAELGRFDEARAALAAGREAALQRWGSGAPMVARHDFDLALLALDRGEFTAAEARLAAAESVFLAAFGADSLYLARVRFARAKLRMVAGEFAAASALVDEALAVYARELGPDHELLAELHEARGVLRFFTDDLAGSLAAYDAALRISTDVFGREHPTLARLHGNIGETQAALGDSDAARVSFDRSLAVYAATLPADHPELALPLKGRGQLALASGRAGEAVVDLERALELRLTTNSEPLEIADLRFSLARALRARDGRSSAHAEALARQARSDFAARDMSEQVAAIDVWLRG